MVKFDCSITELRNDERALLDIKGGRLLPDEGRDAYGTLEKASGGSGMLRRYGLHTDHKSLLTARKAPGRSAFVLTN